MKSLGLLALIGLALTAELALAAAAPDSAQWLLEQVRILSAPEMEGRESGTRGGEVAARHITDVLRQAGVQPGGDGGGYRMAFPVPARVSIRPESDMQLLQPARRSFTLGADWTPAASSADGLTEGEVVFVGYGVTEPDLGYDDYASVDARGKIALALSGEPRRDDRASPFARTGSRPVGQRMYKVRVAREHGARALLLVHRPVTGLDTLPALRDGTAAGDLVAALITRATADAILAQAGERLDSLRHQIDRTLTPASRPLPGVRLRLQTRVVRETGIAANIVGILPGTDPRLAREAVLIGAHYDHLGRSGNGSLDANPAAVHPGADDNASGTAGVLALARAFAASGGTPRTLVFVLFAGEEMGLLGASAYVRTPTFPLDRTVAMVNLDMIGRMHDRRVEVGGLASAAGLEAVVDAAQRGLDLDVARQASPYSPSDHASFYPKGVAVLFVHTGVHPDYHRASDTWEKINAPGMARIVRLVERIVDRLAQGQAPVYAKVEREPAEPANVVYSGNGASYFGVAPDPADDTPGVRLAVVQRGGPAERAGFRDGDIVIRFDGLRLYTPEDLREAIGTKRPGEIVDVVYLREGREHTVKAMLSARPQ